ncbi:hypothetical protein ACIQVK_41420, partial [Streptomyces sp. NPDC090493]|uniref:hypothetical protein n=1 Tax=Streptomyces sp. NPDC090493 TaxID=3365964 RepID=UPI0038061685
MRGPVDTSRLRRSLASVPLHRAADSRPVLDISHLPSGTTPKPVQLCWSGTNATAADTDRLPQAYLWRIDIEMSKPQSCHSCGSSSSLWAPVSFWIIAIRWW